MVEYLLFLLGAAFGIGFMALVNIRSYHKGRADGIYEALNSVFGKNANVIKERASELLGDDDV